MAKTVPYKRKAQYYETDSMAIIHHSNYIRWFEEARVDFMEQMGFGYNKAVEAGIDFALLEVSCKYHSMVRFGEVVAITCFLTELGKSSMSLRYEVRDSAGGELRASGETRHCYFDNRRQRPVALKRAMPELYRLLEGYVEEQ